MERPILRDVSLATFATVPTAQRNNLLRAAKEGNTREPDWALARKPLCAWLAGEARRPQTEIVAGTLEAGEPLLAEMMWTTLRSPALSAISRRASCRCLEAEHTVTIHGVDVVVSPDVTFFTESECRVLRLVLGSAPLPPRAAEVLSAILDGYATRCRDREGLATRQIAVFDVAADVVFKNDPSEAAHRILRRACKDVCARWSGV